MIKKLILSNALVLAMGLPIVGQETCLKTDFSEGIPEDFTLVCHDEMPIRGGDFKKIIPKKTWFFASVNSTDGAAAVSTSRRTYDDLSTDNWMITPKLHLPTENVWLKWTARSIHYQLRDGYKVLISTTGDEYDDFTELYSVNEEQYLWTEHLVSLNEYAGKDVYIAFVHDSQGKFLLAVDDLFIGQPAEADFIVNDQTSRFAGNVGTVSVVGEATNSGIAYDNSALTCVVNDTIVVSSGTVIENWKTGETIPFAFDIPVQVGQVANYKVMIGEQTVWTDSVICSYFPRTILLEKATGAWCVNCTEVISYIHELEERFGDEIVCVEAHAYYGDVFEYMSYVTGLKTNSFPTILINRDRSNPVYNSQAQNRENIKKMLTTPTIAKVDLTLDYVGGDSVSAQAKVTFAVDTDNSTGKYRIGYALIEKEMQTDLMQQINGASSVSCGEYYYMATPVPTDMMWYSNVAHGTETAFSGIKNSLPEAIEGGVEYTIDTRIGIPTSVCDKSKVAIVAIVMNFYTDEVLNVSEVLLPEDLTSVSPIVSDRNSEVNFSLYKDGTCYLSCPEDSPFTLELFMADGRKVANLQASGSGVYRFSNTPKDGIYLMRLVQNGRVWTKKVVIN